MRIGENVRKRADGRYEARYIKGRESDGKIIYGYCYGKTYAEAIEKKQWNLKRQEMTQQPKLMNLLILGAGGYGRQVYEIAKSTRIFNQICFLDDMQQGERIIGKCSEASDFYGEFTIGIAAISDSDIRKRWTQSLINTGFIIPTLIDPTAIVSDSCTIGYGSVICARAVINTDAKIGIGAIVSSGAIIAREAVMPDWGFIDIGVSLAK